MSTVRERIAYVRGLIQGAELAGNGAVARDVLEKMLDIFDALADEIEELDAERLEVEEYLEAIDADLGELEEELLGEDFDDGDGEDDGAEDEGDFVEIECPGCRTKIYFEEAVLFDEDDILCPDCGDVIYRADMTEEDDDESSLL